MLAVELNPEYSDYKKIFKVTWLADPGPTCPVLIPLCCLIYSNLLIEVNITKDDGSQSLISWTSKAEQCLLSDKVCPA
ncbi:hypothetical protein PHET_11830 [Paragonimus heterotremus]|uniref:Uncharacterized protein n=1 Tax=Paragonimus heterotremus TaxID=100268 RepID=A0A8J4SKQ9_9TREM|nr:hypothetical protein PHET_11830 [Paragonimus heterotremus]